MSSRDVKSCEFAILRVVDNRANLPNANIDHSTSSRDVKSYESAIFRVGDNRANIPNANSDYAATFRDVVPTALSLTVINIYCFSFRNVLGCPGMKIAYTTSASEFAGEGVHQMEARS